MKKGQKYPANPLDKSEIRALLESLTKGDLGVRNRAMIFMLWRCGLRVSELCALRPCDVSADSLRVLKGKGSKPRTVGVDVETYALFDHWMTRRRARGIDGRVVLYCDLRGKALHPSGVRTLLKRLGKKAGIEKRCHPHAMRHAFAVNAARQIPLPCLQNALGHSSLAVTSIYVAHLGGEAVDAVRGMTWD